MQPNEVVVNYSARIDARLGKVRIESPTNFLMRASAETHALVRAGAGAKDEIIFLVSETEDGLACGGRLVTLIEAELGCRARMVEIKGLQVRDSNAFRRVGVNALFDAIDGLIKDHAVDDIHLNATGGYKGIIPYVVLYGMFRGIAVSYIYEFSETLLTLPALPIEFDWERLMPAQEAILTLVHEGAIDEKRWRQLLPPDYAANEDRYDSLFEFEDGLITLSVIGLLMKGRLDAAESVAEVFLSPNANKALENSGPAIRTHLDAMLDRVRSPLHRAGFKHAESLHKTDVKVWKVYGSSGPRMLYWAESDRIYVGELFANHNDYEDYVSGSPLSRRDYDTKKFVPIVLMKERDYSKILADIRRSNDEPADKARALEEEIRALKIEVNKARGERNSIRKTLHKEARSAAEHAADKARREMRSNLDREYGEKLRSRDKHIESLEALIGDLNSDIESLRGQIFKDDKETVPDETV
ncbi:MAG: hypothetical protein ACRDHZ_10345 [Ktedonobacteraceae bacterium]